jgi:DNA replication protein DnaC
MAHVEPTIWEQIVDACRSGKAWPLLFVGPVGTGKTCAALCLLDFVYGCRRCSTLQDFCDGLIACQKGVAEYGGAKDTVEHYWRRWSKAECAVMDELGTRDRASAFQFETVKKALDTREDRPTVYISNLTVGQLEQVYDDRIASRLAGGTVIHFQGTDRRIA